MSDSSEDEFYDAQSDVSDDEAVQDDGNNNNSILGAAVADPRDAFAQQQLSLEELVIPSEPVKDSSQTDQQNGEPETSPETSPAKKMDVTATETVLTGMEVREDSRSIPDATVAVVSKGDSKTSGEQSMKASDVSSETVASPAAAAAAAPTSEEPAPVAPPRRRKKKKGQANTVSSLPDSAPASAPASRPQSELIEPKPSDEEILESVMLTCLDTGEVMPLSKAEDRLPPGLNPMALQVMQRTNEFFTESGDGEDASNTRTQKFKSIIGKAKTQIKDKYKEIAEVLKEEEESEDEAIDPEGYVKMKTKKKTPPTYLTRLRIRQRLAINSKTPIWTIKFSPCGGLLATAGQDKVVRVWVLKTAVAKFNAMRTNIEPMEEHNITDADVFYPVPFVSYSGHTADVLDLSWSLTNNYFLLSSSMDKTVRLWHISRQECLGCFLHTDFVTAIAFHPRNDKYFLSGSLDGQLRLWNIPEKRVALNNEISTEGSNLITAACFCRNGLTAVAGTYDGRCVFFNTDDRLKYLTTLHVRSTRGKNAKGRKISGLEPGPNNQDKILVTSNDSRLRLYDLQDLSLTCKYKGATNTSSQIKATFSQDGQFIMCGSEDHYIYVWKTQPPVPKKMKKNWRRDRNDKFQKFSAHEAIVTASSFAPTAKDAEETPRMLVSADYSGCIIVYKNES